MGQSQSFLSSLIDFLNRLFGTPSPQPTPTPTPEPPIDTSPISPMHPRALVIVYNPVIDSAGAKLVQALNWNDPDELIAGYIADVDECSGGLVKYEVVQKIEVSELPVKIDGFRYSPQQYVRVATTNQDAHDPDAVDYLDILNKFNILPRVAANEFDEVWLFGGPYFGFWESAMAGAGAFFSNGGPIQGTASCPRKFVVMGFNYQRGVGEMLEDLGHRAESILARVWKSEDFLGYAYDRARNINALSNRQFNLFERFMLFDQIAPGKSNVGSVHYAPNSHSDYEWGIATPVQSCADDWLQFPNLPDPPNFRTLTARDWGGGDIRAHHKWWLSRLPKAPGATNGISNFWWKYFIDPNTVK